MAIDTAETTTTTEATEAFTMEQPQAEHEWLQKFVGEWETVMQSACGPDGQPMTCTGTLSVRNIGGFFIHGEGVQPGPDGNDFTSFMTVGYDTAQGKYVGTWFGSMMTKLWVYDITREGNTLIMASEGPSFTTPGATTLFHDILELVSDDHHTLTGKFQNEDGSWTEMMKVDNRRKA
jgi:hypothetical protein